MYGNFCGPYWSDGKWQESVIPTVPADDRLDETCRVHDEVYARRGDLREADFNFFRSNFGMGLAATMFAVPVGIQGLFRARDFESQTPTTTQDTPSHTRQKMAPSKQRVNLRGSLPKNNNNNNNNNNKGKMSQPLNGMDITRSMPPTSIGTTIRATRMKMTRSTESARLHGRDFIGTVECNGVATFGLGKSALLSPAYFQSTVLGNLARSFEKYRWNRLRICYVPKVATTAVGQVVLCSQRSVSEPCLAGEAGTFLPRAMSQGNAVFSPLWTPSCIDIDCPDEWHLVDPTIHVDIDDSIHEELQVYTQSSIAGQVGYLFAEYDVEFKEPIYQPHSTAIPLFTGPGLRATLTSNLSISAFNALIFSDPTAALASSTAGTIYRAAFDLQGSVAPTGAPFASGFSTNTVVRTNTNTSTGGTVVTQPIIGGITLYLVYGNSTSIYAYTSLEAAVNGGGTGQLYSAVSSVIGSWNFDLALVRIGIAQLPAVQ